MKLAICVTGLCRGDTHGMIIALRKHFPTGDFFFGTWENKPSVSDKTKFYPEPKIHYHPVLDVETSCPAPKWEKEKHKCVTSITRRRRVYHHTKQILGHAYLLNDIPDDYDMIIRARYDINVSNVNFTPWLEKSYTEKRAVGFGTRWKRHPVFDKLKEISKIYPTGNDKNVSNDWGWYLMDPMIFHPRSLFDVNNVFELHKTKKLRPAEWGWYQVLSEPYEDNHCCVYGGIAIEKHYEKYKT